MTRTPRYGMPHHAASPNAQNKTDRYLGASSMECRVKPDKLAVTAELQGYGAIVLRANTLCAALES